MPKLLPELFAQEDASGYLRRWPNVCPRFILPELAPVFPVGERFPNDDEEEEGVWYYRVDWNRFASLVLHRRRKDAWSGEETPLTSISWEGLPPGDLGEELDRVRFRGPTGKGSAVEFSERIQRAWEGHLREDEDLRQPFLHAVGNVFWSFVASVPYMYLASSKRKTTEYSGQQLQRVVCGMVLRTLAYQKRGEPSCWGLYALRDYFRWQKDRGGWERSGQDRCMSEQLDDYLRLVL